MVRYILTSLLTIFAVATFDANGSEIDLKKRKRGCVTHVVNYGEDITTILKRYEVTLLDLEMVNDQKSITEQLSPGTLLFIPRSKIGKASQDQIKRDINQIRGVDDSSKHSTEDNKGESGDLDHSKLAASTQCFQHVSKKGETLESISKLYNISVEDILIVNSDIKNGKISAGYIVNVPVKPIDRGTFVEFPDVKEQQTELVDVNWGEISTKRDFEFVTDDDKTLRVSLLLPLKSPSGATSNNFLQFYQGFLIGLDSLKSEGLSVEMNVVNVDKESSDAAIDSLIYLNSIDNSSIVIGPVYDNHFGRVAEVLSEKNIPIISPLASVKTEVENAFQVAPIEDTKYDKLRLKIEGKNVILLKSDKDDVTFVDKIKEFTSGELVEFDFDVKKKPEEYVEEQLTDEKENIYIVAATDPMQADAIISKVGMIKMFAIGKKVSAVATPRVARMSNINPSNLFAADVSYITSYHADQTNKSVKEFERRYMLNFGSSPSLYSYRGYDVALFFLGSLKEFETEFYETIEDYYTTILQVTYRFVREENGGKFVNDEWMYINYKPSYDIVVE